MKRWTIIFAAILLASAAHAQSMLYGVTTTVAPISAEVLNSPAYAELLASLRQGGHVIYLRHAQTDTSAEKSVGEMSDCSWQRNLSDNGQRQARLVGARLQELAIPITTVEASPFCRTRQTAELAFGRAPSINADLFYHSSQPPEQVAAANARLKQRLGAAAPRDGNLVMVGHSPAMREAGAIELPEGQAAIVKPASDGTFRIVGRLSEAGVTPQ
jgi:phosphohistidine phosphatase SixA